MAKISIEDYKKLTKKKNKFNANKTEYNGRVFDSKKEADYAKRLEWLRHAKDKGERVVEIHYQVPYPVYIKNTHVFTYICDFKVKYADKREEVIDVKGYRKGTVYAMFRLKKKCVEAYYKITITEV